MDYGDDYRVNVTRHAEKRAKSRIGLNKKSAYKNAEKAFKYGIRHSETSGRLNRYISSLFFNNTNANNIRIYGEFVYIFCGETLVTVMDLPQMYKGTVKKIVSKKRSKK